MNAIDSSCDILYKDIISSGAVKIINFGENIDSNICPPNHFELYCLPFYEKRCSQLREAGIYSHIHIDGSFKAVLKHLSALPFDGLEALTPVPQGDVTLDEIKQHCGDKILLDVIPAVLFLPTFPEEQLVAETNRILELFYPRVIVGVSDELPPGSDIERIRKVSQICREFQTPLK
jgi:hypothetical protein